MDGITATTAPPASSAPLPPRYRALRRCVVFALALVAWNVGLWFAWNYEADRRLRAFVAERRALGEPVLAEDFAVTSIPEEENAAAELVRIGAAVEADPFLRQFANSNTPYEPFQDCDDQGRPHLAPIAPMIAQIQAALQLPGLDYGARFAPGSNGEGGRKTFSVVRNGAQFLRAAREAYELHDDALGQWTVIEAMIGVAERSTCPPHGIIGVLSLDGHYREAVRHILAVAARGSIANDEERELVSRVLRALLRGSEKLPQSHQAGWWGFRFEAIDSVTNGTLPAEHPRGGGLLNPWWELPPWWFLQLSRAAGSLLKLDAVHFARELTWFADASQRGDWGAGHLTPKPPIESGLPIACQKLLDSTRTSSAHMQGCHSAAGIRVASVILAARLFEFDHGGLPSRLEELVPTYLDQVPIDPFSPEEAPLHYLRHADPPRVFSVGPKGHFDGRPKAWLTLAKIEQSYDFFREHIGLLPERAAMR